jgi:hypothetical protein
MAIMTLIQEARDAGLAIAAEGGELVIRGPRRLATLARQLIDQKADVLLALRSASAPRADSGRTATRCLIGNGFPPIPPTIPAASILATPAIPCPACGLRPVLPELRRLTDGRCYECWVAQGASAPPSNA